MRLNHRVAGNRLGEPTARAEHGPDVRVVVADLLQELETVRARHAKVGEHDVHGLAPEDLHRGFRGIRFEDGKQVFVDEATCDQAIFHAVVDQ